jgi:phosphatidylserine decarboxylase
VAGHVVGWRHVPGTLFSVNAGNIRREPGLFVRNERFITLIEMDGGGLVAVVMVAAVGVGHVTVSYDPEVATHQPEFFRAALRHRRYEQPKPIGRGEELGIFHLGSTTIVVFEPGRVELDSLASGASVKMGVGVGRLAATTSNPRG